MKINANPQYLHGKLEEILADPYEQFSVWLQEAEQQTNDPRFNAFALSTTGDSGQPTSRVVLLKRHSQKGFVFVTSYQSAKGKDIEQNNKVSMLFYWSALEREVRIEGEIFKTTLQESDELFYERPRLGQVATLITQQSRPLNSRAELENEFERLSKQYEDDSITVPRPDSWGGYLIKPVKYEFWQGGEYRLNYRYRFLIDSDGWRVGRLYP